MEMNTRTENEMVIRATAGEPVLWDGGEEGHSQRVLALLRKRTMPSEPMTLARLTGFTRLEVNKYLLRLKRAGLAEPVSHGKWVAS